MGVWWAEKLTRRRVLLTLLAAAGAGALVGALPPQVAYQPQLLVAFALLVLGVTSALLPGAHLVQRLARFVGLGMIWGVAAWCLVSQPSGLIASLGREWSLRLAPLAVAL